MGIFAVFLFVALMSIFIAIFFKNKLSENFKIALWGVAITYFLFVVGFVLLMTYLAIRY
jgi:hypothetical protein